MKNANLVEEFVLGSTEGSGSHLHIEGDDLVNYTTVIARRYQKAIVVNTYYYSQTTNRNIRYVKKSARANDIEIIEVDGEKELMEYGQRVWRAQ